jgi:hypothetical protein
VPGSVQWAPVQGGDCAGTGAEMTLPRWTWDEQRRLAHGTVFDIRSGHCSDHEGDMQRRAHSK